MNTKTRFFISVTVILLLFVGWIWYFGVRTAPEQPQPEPAGIPEKKIIVQAVKDSNGKYHLADEKGNTLYTTNKDGPNQSNCYDECAKVWPPFLALTENIKPANDVSGKVIVIDRNDGAKQYSYIDQPLYYYEGDTKLGDVNGNGVGDVWFAAKP